MKQVFLKSSFNLGWGSSHYRVALGGEGDTTTMAVDGAAKVVVPIAGTFSNLNVYSPTGTHPNYTVTVMINGVVSALKCTLASGSTQAKDVANSVVVTAGDDVFFDVNVNPLGAGVGYPMNFSVEFEGAQQFYGIACQAGTMGIGDMTGGGALGNGILQDLATQNQLTNSYSICTITGNITGLTIKSFLGDQGVGNGWTGYLVKNQILQDGTGGTVDTTCVLSGTDTLVTKSFTLPVVPGDLLDFSYIRVGSVMPFSQTVISLACSVTPDDATSFMACGGNNDAVDSTNLGWKWVQSEQLEPAEAIVQCPIGPRGIIIKGLYIRVKATGLGTAGVGMTFTIRKNGVDTAATVTLLGADTDKLITGLSIPFVDGDLISLGLYPQAPPALTGGIGLKWGLSLETAIAPAAASGIYFINPDKATKHDSYYGDIELKIPNPTIKTALIGE